MQLVFTVCQRLKILKLCTIMIAIPKHTPNGTVNTDLNTLSIIMSMSSSRGRTKKMTFFTSAGGILPFFKVNIFSTSCSWTIPKEINLQNICCTKMHYQQIYLFLCYEIVLNVIILVLLTIKSCVHKSLALRREYCAMSPKGPVRYSSQTMA